MMGMIRLFNKVEVKRPPRITLAIGLWISLPGRSPFKTMGTRANAEVRAVMRMGVMRSVEPWMTLRRGDSPWSRRSL